MKRKYRTYTDGTGGAVNSMAYKGYMVINNPFTAEKYIRKDGYHIATVSTWDQAKREIDGLVDPVAA